MKIGKISVTFLITSIFVLMFSAVSFAKTAETSERFNSSLWHYDFGWKAINYDLHVIEEYTVYKKYDEVELEHHHAVAIGNTGRYTFKMELVVNSVYKDGNGTIGRVNFSDYKWRDRLTDYISETGMSYYGGGNKKLLTGTLSETPKVTATSGAIADGVHYGNTDSITLTLK